MFSRNKIIAGLVSVFTALSCANLLAAGALVFWTTMDRKVQIAQAQEGMKFYADPETFKGKDIVEIVPLSESDKEAVVQAFEEAKKTSGQVNVSYKLEGLPFNAKIMNFQGLGFIVRVTEAETGMEETLRALYLQDL